MKYEVIHVITASPSIMNRPIAGQDFFLINMVKTLLRMPKNHALFVSPFSLNIFLRRSKDRIEEPIFVFHLYYTDLKNLISMRLASSKANAIRVLHVYQLYDASWSISQSIKHRVYLFLSQFLVDKYLVTSRTIYSGLRRFIPAYKLHLVEPYYECPNRTIRDLKNVLNSKVEDLACKRVRLLYIGRINEYRFDPKIIMGIIRRFAELGYFVELDIVSLREMGLHREGHIRLSYNYGKEVEIKFLNRLLSETEKKQLYEKAHILLFLSKKPSAMSPPMSVIESVCYGVIPLMTRHVAADLGLQNVENYVNVLSEKCTVEEAFEKMMLILENFDSIAIDLYKTFSRFYSDKRFIKDLLLLSKK